MDGLEHQVDVDERDEKLEWEDFAVFWYFVVVGAEFDEVDAKQFKNKLDRGCVQDG